MTKLLEAADGLYALPLSEFTPARDALARQLREDDRDLAARVKALRKPSTAAWVVNLLARREAEQVDQVISVGTALREAQASLDGEELRALTKQRRQLTAAVTRRARSLATEHGVRVTSSVADQVEATLTAAMVEAEVGAAVRSGLLLAAVVATGVGDLDPGAYVAVPDALGFTPSPLEQPVPGPPDLRVVPDPDELDKRRRTAREALADADADLDVAVGEASAATARVNELEAHTLQVQAEIDELRRRVTELEEEQDGVDEELAEARAVVAQAQEDVRGARAELDRAAAALERLDRLSP